VPSGSNPRAPLPAYLQLGMRELRARARRAVEELKECRACPRDCGVDRLLNRWSACKTGRWAVVSSAFPHRGEEDCLRGWRGSGTIFFAHCNLRCVFCQNHDISQGIRPPSPGTPPRELADIMLTLQDRGCHNINLVTPEHVVPQILEALPSAVDRGLRLPLVYNTSAYDSLATLALLDGVVDIFMPDLKMLDPDLCARYLKARDYPERATAAIQEMHRQVGPLAMGDRGLARRGVLVRHLVMPGLPEETRSVLRWLARELGPRTFVNIMDQYRPAWKVGPGRYQEIDHALKSTEYRAALRFAAEVGLERLAS